ncbi:MAG: flavodoxin [Segetibacter sp.]|jgi:hypothetical protein|nr:flavodoxin [Segetibacter sp.]
MSKANTKMKIAFCLPVLIALCFTSGCSNAQAVSPKKVLIVYQSATNNIKAVAEIIHKQVGGTVAGLELEKPILQTIKLCYNS